jgi:hypothetical protein
MQSPKFAAATATPQRIAARPDQRLARKYPFDDPD